MHARELLADTAPYLSPRLVLDGVPSDLADRHLPGAPHTIAEIVAHMAFWQAWHHLGQVVLLRQLLGAWPQPAGS